MDDQLKTLQSWINESSYTVAVTGAGVSVTAGIPDMQHMNIVSTLQMMSETILKAARQEMQHFPRTCNTGAQVLQLYVRKALKIKRFSRLLLGCGMEDAMITRIMDNSEKQRIARTILEALPEWFEVEESREKYIADCAGWVFLAAREEDGYAGFLCLKETGKDTVELAVMGVLKEYHRKGIGRALFEKAKVLAAEAGYSFMQVKTVRMGMYADYDITNRFYISCGFKEFEVIPELWGESNPCQIYVMSLK